MSETGAGARESQLEMSADGTVKQVEIAKRLSMNVVQLPGASQTLSLTLARV